MAGAAAAAGEVEGVAHCHTSIAALIMAVDIVNVLCPMTHPQLLVHVLLSSCCAVATTRGGGSPSPCVILVTFVLLVITALSFMSPFPLLIAHVESRSRPQIAR